MKYEIVVEETLTAMENRINAMLELGWKPLGGVGYSFIQQDTERDGKRILEQYTQAMTKVDDVCFCGEENLVQKEIQECQKLIAQKLKP